jgi:hypothetical protein
MGASSRRVWVLGLALAGLSLGGPLAAQQPAKAAPAKPAAAAPKDAPAAAPATAPAADAELTQFAKAYVAVGLVRDDYSAQMALPKNKTIELQTQLKEDYRKKVEAVVQAAGLTMAAYHRIEFSISVDPARRAALDQILAAAQNG